MYECRQTSTAAAATAIVKTTTRTIQSVLGYAMLFTLHTHSHFVHGFGSRALPLSLARSLSHIILYLFASAGAVDVVAILFSDSFGSNQRLVRI